MPPNGENKEVKMVANLGKQRQNGMIGYLPIAMYTEDSRSADSLENSQSKHNAVDGRYAAGIPHDSWWSDWYDNFECRGPDQSEDVYCCFVGDYEEFSYDRAAGAFDQWKSGFASSDTQDFNADVAVDLKHCSSSCITDEKIRNLKALLAEHEKALKRLKTVGKEIVKNGVCSAELALSYHSCLCFPAKSCQEKKPFNLINGNCNMNDELRKEERSQLGQKRLVSETARQKQLGLPNTKRFRYYLRKDVSQIIKTHSPTEKAAESCCRLFPCASELTKADIKNTCVTKEEFLSFLGLLRSDCLTQQK